MPGKKSFLHSMKPLTVSIEQFFKGNLNEAEKLAFECLFYFYKSLAFLVIDFSTSTPLSIVLAFVLERKLQCSLYHVLINIMISNEVVN
jgi:hypothetical protein